MLKEELWTSRMDELKSVKAPPWRIFQLRKATSSLKKNRTADPNEMINEIFQEECVEKNLQDALLSLFNGIKDTFHFPEYLLKENITTIYKYKGSRLDLNND